MTLKLELFKFVLVCAVFSACSNPPPDKYFQIAVLNTNLLVGFADDGHLRELESTSVKLSEDNIEIAMKRSEIVDFKITSIEETFEKLKELKSTDDPVTDDMLKASKELYDFVIPVYKNEYKELAELYDNSAGSEQTEAYSKSIHEKYFPEYKQLYDNLIRTGKLFADRNNIKVNWGGY